MNFLDGQKCVKQKKFGKARTIFLDLEKKINDIRIFLSWTNQL